MVQINFDGRNETPQFGFPTFPDGWIHVRCVKTEVVTPKSESGNMLSLHVVGVAPPAQGQTGILNYNLWHAKEPVAKRAREQLTATALVAGVGSMVQDTDAFVGREFFILNKPKGDGYNNVQDVKTVDGRSPQEVLAQGGGNGFGGQGGMPTGGFGAPQGGPPQGQQWGAPQGQPQGQPPQAPYAAQGQPPAGVQGQQPNPGAWGASQQGQPPQGAPVGPGPVPQQPQQGGPGPGQQWGGGQPTQPAAPMPAQTGTWQPNGAQPATGPNWGNPQQR